MSATSDREKIFLISERVVETIEKLVARISERFGNCGLANVCAQLSDIAKQDMESARAIEHRYT
jgi:hypothetical protein